MNRAIKYLFSFRCVALLCALSLMQQATAQTLPFYGDSSRFSPLKNGAGNEIIIESSTKNIHGALVNYANGRTHFKLVIDTVFSLNDTTLRFRFTDGSTKDLVTHGSGAVTVESDPIAIAKTITITPGIGMLGSASTQALNVNPSFTTNIDTFAISTRAWRQKLADSLGAIIGTKVSSETDPVATAKTITITGSSDVPVTGGTQTIGANPSYTIGSVNWANGYPTYDLRYASLLNSDFIASGGIVTWISGYTYNVSPAVYYINGVRYTSPSTNITLSAADATFDRIDVFALTTSGTAVAITGTPTSNPEKPDIDNNTQIEASFAVVEHATTQPTINQEWIYRENADWTTAVSNASINPNSTNSPFAGSKDVEGTAVANTHNITYTRGTSLNISTFSNAVLSFEIKSKSSWSTNKKFTLQWFNGTTAVGNAIPFGDQSYGFVSSSTSSYFLVSIPLKDFGALSTVTRLRMQAANTTGTFGFFIDNIQIQSVTQTGTTETDPIADAKTVTITPGIGMLGSASTQTLINNPSFTTNVDTFAIETRARGLKLIDSLKTVANSNYVPLTRTITINGTTLDLSANRTWTLTTDNVAEGSTNKYYTDARARAAISLTTTGSGAATYNNSTGVLNVPTPAAGGSGTLVHTYAPLVISGDTIYKRFDILSYGATPATTVYDGAMTSGSATLTSATAGFVSGDVGKTIVVKRAGTSGRDLITTIASFTNSTTVSLIASASSTVSVAQVVFGLDCTIAIQNAVNAADAAGGGEVFVPLGTFMVGGSLQTSVGGNNMNAQIYLPYHAVSSHVRTHITIKGESKPIAAPQGGGLSFDATTQYPNTGSNLYSTLTSGATDCAVIGTGGSFNESTLSVENLMIIVNNNPTGTGPVVGGISIKNGSSVQVKNVVVTIDTTGYRSTYPSNDISGIETTDNSHETFNTIENTLVIGFRSGYKIGEHCSLNQVQTMVCFYAFYIKSGSHTSSCLRAGAFWCAYDIYVRGGQTLSLFRLDGEWQQNSKWYDDVNTIKDSANLLSGDLFYTIVSAGVGIDNTKFSKSGGSNINAYSDATPIASSTARNLNTGGVVFSNGTDITVDDTKLNWDNTNKLLSIGTTTHTDVNGNVKLYVQGSAATDIATFTDGTAKLGIFANNADANAPLQIGTLTNHSLYFYTNNGSNGMLLNAAGNLGIGVLSASTPTFRTTNAGSDVNAKFMVNPGGSISTAGKQAFGFDNTNGFVFNAANGTREIARAAFNITNLTNTAGSEAADLSFYTQSGGNAIAEKMRVTSGGGLSLTGTNTAAGTTGAQTINKPTGTVNFAAGASSLVVTNSLVTTSSLVFAVIRTNDATAVIKNVVPASGSFTITLNATATAETSVAFWVVNNF